MALEVVRRREDDLPLVVCSDSQAALATFASGAGAQTTALGAALWDLLLELQSLQVDVRCTCSGSPHTKGFLETRRRTGWLRRPPAYHKIMFLWMSALSTVLSVAPPPKPCAEAGTTAYSGGSWGIGCRDRSSKPETTRSTSTNFAQATGDAQCLHRIGRNPSHACQQCSELKCQAVRWLVCREGPDTPEHVLLEGPCLAGARLRLLGQHQARGGAAAG